MGLVVSDNRRYSALLEKKEQTIRKLCQLIVAAKDLDEDKKKTLNDIVTKYNAPNCAMKGCPEPALYSYSSSHPGDLRCYFKDKPALLEMYLNSDYYLSESPDNESCKQKLCHIAIGMFCVLSLWLVPIFVTMFHYPQAFFPVILGSISYILFAIVLLVVNNDDICGHTGPVFASGILNKMLSPSDNNNSFFPRQKTDSMASQDTEHLTPDI